MATTKETDIRILLVGKTGQGKSATANSIIGKHIFEVSDSAASVTMATDWSNVIYKRFGRSVEVVDTPGFFDTHRSEEDIKVELIKCLLYTAPGFHAIAFVLQKGRFTDELVKTKDLFFSWFGPGVEKFACIILTHTEDEEAVTHYLAGNIPQGLADLVDRCGGKGRIAPIDNKAEQEKKDKQVERLFNMIEEIKKVNENEHFSNAAYQLATQYAYTRYSGKISTEIINILRKAGLQIQLSETCCKVLGREFQIENEGGSDTASDIAKDRQVRIVDLNTVLYGDVELADDEDLVQTLKEDVKKGKATGLFNTLRCLFIRGQMCPPCKIL